jgi:hypothetical protein
MVAGFCGLRTRRRANGIGLEMKPASISWPRGGEYESQSNAPITSISVRQLEQTAQFIWLPKVTTQVSSGHSLALHINMDSIILQEVMIQF